MASELITEQDSNQWPLYRLGDLASIKGGKRMPAGTALVSSKSEHPYLRIVDFRNGTIDPTALQYVPNDVFPEISRYTIGPKDVYISIVGTIGMVGMIPKFLDGANLTENAAKVCDISPKLLPQFLSAYLRSTGGQDQIGAMTVGSTQPKLALFRIADMVIPCPPLPVQQAIVETISSLEDRIYFFTTTNKTLELIAQAIFKSWFVDFDPVWAKAEGREPEGMDAAAAAFFPSTFQQSAQKQIPTGWSFHRLSEFMEVNPLRSLPKGVPAPYLEMSNAPTTGPRPIGWIDRLPISGCRFRNGDTLLAKITPCLENGKTAFVDFLDEDQIGWGSTEFVVLRPKRPIPSVFGYLLARDKDFRAFAIQSMSGTSGRQRVQVDQLEKFEFAIADGGVYRAFAGIVEPMFKLISHNDNQIKTLSEIRDTLLPRLISGKLRVPEAEKLAEALL